jgi:hypothetical protein
VAAQDARLKKAQRFLSIHAAAYNAFNIATSFRLKRTAVSGLQLWRQWHQAVNAA